MVSRTSAGSSTNVVEQKKCLHAGAGLMHLTIFGSEGYKPEAPRCPGGCAIRNICRPAIHLAAGRHNL